MKNLPFLWIGGVAAALIGAVVILAVKVLGGPGWALVVGVTVLVTGALTVASCDLYMRMTGPTLKEEPTPPPYPPKAP